MILGLHPANERRERVWLLVEYVIEKNWDPDSNYHISQLAVPRFQYSIDITEPSTDSPGVHIANKDPLRTGSSCNNMV